MSKIGIRIKSHKKQAEKMTNQKEKTKGQKPETE